MFPSGFNGCSMAQGYKEEIYGNSVLFLPVFYKAKITSKIIFNNCWAPIYHNSNVQII